MNCYCICSFLSVSGFLQTSAISCMGWKFVYQMSVYVLNVYGDVLVMNFTVFLPFFLSLVSTDNGHLARGWSFIFI